MATQFSPSVNQEWLKNLPSNKIEVIANRQTLDSLMKYSNNKFSTSLDKIAEKWYNLTYTNFVAKRNVNSAPVSFVLRNVIPWSFAEHPDTSAKQLDKLSRNKDSSVRERVARHKNTSLETRARLEYQDKHPAVREIAANYTREIMYKNATGTVVLTPEQSIIYNKDIINQIKAGTYDNDQLPTQAAKENYAKSLEKDNERYSQQLQSKTSPLKENIAQKSLDFINTNSEDKGIIEWLHCSYKPSETNKEQLLEVATKSTNPEVLSVLYEEGNDGGNNPTGQRIEAKDIKEVCQTLANNPHTPTRVQAAIEQQWGNLRDNIAGKLPTKIGGTELTPEQRTALQEGKTITMEGLMDKNGKSRTAHVFFDKETGKIKCTVPKNKQFATQRTQQKVAKPTKNKKSGVKM